DVSVIQLFVLLTVHGHPPALSTSNELLVAPVPRLALPGLTDTVHDAAFCVSTSVWSPIISAPIRSSALGLASTPYVTVPFPGPLVPNSNSTQLLVVVAVQLQPALVVTLTVLVAAPEPCERLLGDRL